MRNYLIAFALLLTVGISSATAIGQKAHFKVLAFYSTNVEADHVQFARDALKFFGALAAKDNFTFDSTTNWAELTSVSLKQYQLVVWLNEFPHNDVERKAFQSYMTNGGAWLGFHVSAYNDKNTKWPWFVNFLGDGVFDINSWPPLAAKLVVDDRARPVTEGLPATYISPANEWYRWEPSPRLNKDVQVLLTLDPSNYPLGIKNIVTGGDIPVVWTNTKYKMLYMNMGHGDKIFTSPIQNKMFENAILWLGRPSAHAQIAVTNVPTGSAPFAIAMNPVTDKIYVVNREGNSVTVIDGATRATATISGGARPEAVAVNTATNKIYVANAGDSTVSVIDGTTNSITATLRMGSNSQSLVVNPAANNIYVANNFGHSVTVIDGATNSTATIRVGEGPRAIALNSVTNKVYTVNYGSKDVTVIDGANNSTATVKAGLHPWAIAVASKTDKIYIVNEESNTVTVINGATSAANIIGVGDIPFAVAVNPTTGNAYVLSYGDNTLAVIDGTTNLVATTVHLGTHPQAIAINPQTNEIYIANQRTANVTVMNGANNSLTTTVGAGTIPYAFAIDPATNKLYVANFGSDNVMVIDNHTTR